MGAHTAWGGPLNAGKRRAWPCFQHAPHLSSLFLLQSATLHSQFLGPWRSEGGVSSPVSTYQPPTPRLALPSSHCQEETTSPLFFTFPVLYFTTYLFSGLFGDNGGTPSSGLAPRTHRAVPRLGGSEDTAPPSPGSIPLNPRLPGSLLFSFVPVPRLPRTLSESPLTAPYSLFTAQHPAGALLRAGWLSPREAGAPCLLRAPRTRTGVLGCWPAWLPWAERAPMGVGAAGICAEPYGIKASVLHCTPRRGLGVLGRPL